MQDLLTTHEVAEKAQVHRDTLLRWLREGRIPEPMRDRNGWRVFTPKEAEAVVLFAQNGQQVAASEGVSLRESTPVYAVSPIAKLQKLDWDFADALTGYLTHSLHPYPAKYIPQIPNALIQELSSVGDTVLDPFSGSGTTLVEALLLKRHAIGVDANPLACLIARAKTTRLNKIEVESLHRLSEQAAVFLARHTSGTMPLFPDSNASGVIAKRPSFEGLNFWKVLHANTLDAPETGLVDLVVCSPPYPNAYSYHLYHRTRMLWLDMDQPTFKQVEIGSHRKYSKKGNGAADAGTFRAELSQILNWLGKCLRLGGYACFVIGDSILKGEVVHNDQLLAEAAAENGYCLEANLTRRLQDNKKSFNPVIGKVKDEHIVILRNRGGSHA